MRMNSCSRASSPRPLRLVPSITPPRGRDQLSRVHPLAASWTHSPLIQPRSAAAGRSEEGEEEEEEEDAAVRAANPIKSAAAFTALPLSTAGNSRFRVDGLERTRHSGAMDYVEVSPPDALRPLLKAAWTLRAGGAASATIHHK